MSNSNQRTNIGPIIMIVAGIIILLGVIVWVVLNSVPIPSASAATTLDITLTPTIDPLLSLPRVSLADARQAYDQNKAFFLDVRDIDSYNAGHITGAKNIPLTDLQNNISSLDPTQWIITYCT